MGRFGRTLLRASTVICALFGCLAAPAQSADATLTVRTIPSGVEVWLNNKYLGESPILERRVAPGKQTLRFLNDATRSSAVEEIILTAGEHTVIERAIRPKTGTLRVTTRPAGADVTIATSAGQTPLDNPLMTPGRYRLRIEKSGGRYESITEEISVAAGDTVTLERTLVRVSPFTKKALARVLLGAGAAAAFTWALIEQGEYRSALEKSKSPSYSLDERGAFYEESESAAVFRTLGLIAGGACVIAFEIVAFF